MHSLVEPYALERELHMFSKSRKNFITIAFTTSFVAGMQIAAHPASAAVFNLTDGNAIASGSLWIPGI